jgi:rhodanese-related sulfurtransferase
MPTDGYEEAGKRMRRRHE